MASALSRFDEIGALVRDVLTEEQAGRQQTPLRAFFVLLILGTMLLANSAAAYDANDPNNCNGVDWDDQNALVISKIVASPRVNFVKSPYDDNFKAESCPAATEACRRKAYLVTGDLVLTGKTRGGFTCASHQPPGAKKQTWTTGWLPNAALTPLAPMARPDVSDWIGTWSQPGGTIEIKGGRGGRLKIEGEMVVPGAQDVHTGVIEAEVKPGKDIIAFLNDGSLPFQTADDSGCKVRMQRIGSLLLVEDNDGCGGAGVTFTGLYRRK